MPTYKKRVGSIDAKDSSGHAIQIIIYQLFSRSESREGISEKPLPRQNFETADGRSVNWISKGVYEIFSTGERLTSDDPNAP
jgi:hypothetical protein